MEKEPKRLSSKVVGILVAIALFMIVVLILVGRGCSISEKQPVDTVDKSTSYSSNGSTNSVKSGENTKESVDSSDEKPETDNFGNPIVAENSSDSVGSTTEDYGMDEDKESTEIQSNTKDTEINTETPSGLVEIEEPSLGEVQEINALVSGKSVYKNSDVSYAYSINLILPLEDGNTEVTYYCSKRTYDGVSNGDTLRVEYQLGDKGMISINTVSK